jgi:hypothetical protein
MCDVPFWIWIRRAVRTPNVAEWFDEGELEQCPHCDDARLLPRTDGGELICLTCGPLSALEARGED